MTTIRRRISTSGVGTRVPVRVEDPGTGRTVATTVAGRDGWWAVDVPPGTYRVAEKWGVTHSVTVPSGGSWDVDVLTGDRPAVTESVAAPGAADMTRTLARHKRARRAGS